jgi:hypothetical protein
LRVEAGAEQCCFKTRILPTDGLAFCGGPVHD